MFTAKIRETSMGKMRSMRLLAVILVPMVALIMGVAAPQVWAWGFDDFCVEELDEAEVFFEFNSTDCDVGIQFFWDGEPWKLMIVKDEDGRAVLDVFPLRNVRAVGLTEARFEGAEPQLIFGEEDCDHEDPEIAGRIQEFMEKYKDGPYTFKGMSVEGCLLEGSSELSYDLPEPPEITFPEEDSGSALRDFLRSPTILWEQDEAEEYEVVAEVEFGGNTFVDTATLPGGATQYTVSPEFVSMVRRAARARVLEVFKVEVIAIADNKTITELVIFELPDEE